jgi:hypothetical protein
MAATHISPELALVDPQLRLAHLKELPRLEAFDFLRFAENHNAEPKLELADGLDAPRRSLLLAAVAYACSTLVRVVFVDVLIVLALAGAVSAVELLT